jgi:HD-like signal output (HDOD) protein
MLHSMNALLQSKPHADVALVRKAASTLGILGGAGLSAPSVLAALCAPGSSLEDISRLISREPGLAARVLKVANSAFYGLSRNVTTIDRALVVLGQDSVRGIAAAACLDRTLMRSPESALIQRQALVTHSFATGSAAWMLARLARRALAAEAFTAGLLHNLGLPIQALLGPAGVQALLASLATDPTQDVRALESQHGLASHEACAAIVFDLWRLPPSLIAATSHHHDPDNAPEAHRPLTWLVHLGMQVAAEAGFGFSLEPRHPPCDAERLVRLGLVPEQVAEIQALLPSHLEGLQQAFAET